ncbi:MAG: ATP-grasp domain-containing protein [Deltaproteobacteria bacterium]|nr:ATP-grasp domain-containing protein [Deltaproteobacteria bacterium]
MSEIYFSNYQLEKNTHYFLYIGSIKNYGLNIFLKEALSKIYNREFDFISVIQDIFAQYPYPNLMVVNPRVEEFSRAHGQKASCRVPTRIFLSSVSNNKRVIELVQTLLDRQKKLYIYMYESMQEMNFDQLPGVSIIGPDSKISERLNSKIFQYKACKNFLPMVDFRICSGLDELLKTTDKLRSDWAEGIFVSEEYSAGGLKSIVAHNSDDIVKKFEDKRKNYLIGRYIPHDSDPTVLGVVANENDIYIAGIADQFIEHGNQFVGSVFPTALEKTLTTRLGQHTRKVGQWLAREGFRGIFGCDYIVDPRGRIFFIEVNARKQGTAMEFCCTLENTLPKGSAMLPELEYYAVFQDRFPEHTVEMQNNFKKIHWGTHNYKTHGVVNTGSTISCHGSERKAFRQLAENRVKQDVLIIDHIGSGLVVAEKSFLARVVSLGKNRPNVLKGIGQGKKNIESTIKSWSKSK